MTGLALTLALLAAVMHATWNLIVKGSGDRVSTVTLMGLIGSMASMPVVYLAYGPPAGVWDHVVFSAIVHAGYLLALVAAYRRIDFSVAYPIARGMAPALVAIGGFLFLGDRLDWWGLAAIAVIVVALMALAWSRQARRGINWAFLTGFLIAVYTVNDAAAVRETGGALTYSVTVMAAMTVLLLPIALARRGPSGLLRALAEKPLPLVVAGLLNIGAYALVLAAATLAPVALVAAVRESSVIIGAAAGVFLFAEPFGRKRLAGAAAVAAAVIGLGLV